MSLRDKHTRPGAPVAPATPARLPLLAAIVLVVLTVAAYWRVGQLGFVGYDDPQYISGNALVLRGLSLEGLRYAFATTELGNWHPLVHLSHMSVVQLFGTQPGPHHTANLVLHLACVLLLFALLMRMTGKVWPSALAAGLFALHPLHVESVAWIAERKDVLSTLFWVLTLHAWVSWVRGRRALTFVAVLVAFAAGLMSKPMLVSLPFTLLLLDVWPLRRWRALEPQAGLPLGRLLLEKAPLFVLAGAAMGITVLAQRSAGALGSTAHFELWTRVLNAARSLGIYLAQTLWPVDLAVFYPYPDPIAPLQVIAAAIVVVGLSAAALRSVRRAPFVLVGWLWFLVTLVPVLGLVQVGLQAHADRYTYVPHIGLFVAFAFGLDALLREPFAGQRVRALVALLLCGGLLLLTRRQVEVWRDDATLFAHAAAVTEGNYLAHDYLGRSLLAAGRPAEAVAEQRAAIAARPGFASSHVNLGQALEQAGDLEGALASYRAAIELQPDFTPTYANLGAALAKLQRHDEAAAVLEQAISIDPRAPGVRMNAVLNELARGHLAAAVAHYHVAVELDPTLIEHDNALFLAWNMATSPDPDVRDGRLAVLVAQSAVRRTQEREPMPLEALAAALAESGRFEDARRTAELARTRATALGQKEVAARLTAALALYAAGQPSRSGE